MLDLGGIDVDEIATMLADQTDHDHRWLLDPRTRQVAFWIYAGQERDHSGNRGRR